MNGYCIICGVGRTGKHIIDALYKTGRFFVAIDKGEGVCKKLSEKGILFIMGDALILIGETKDIRAIKKLAE